VLSSKNEGKQEVRFAARLDVLMERLDTLASTVATTASAMAKKDGEIAALRRDLEARDQTLQTLVAQAHQGAQAPQAGAASVDANELRSLRNAVAALTKERAEGGNGTHVVEGLATKVQALGARVEELAEALETRPADRPSEELVTMLATLRSKVEALAGLGTGVSEEQLDRRFGETDDALARLTQRLDTLAATVEEAAAGLGAKERELAGLHRDFTESSTRIESIVDDIREALHAFREVDSTSLDELASRIERVESTTHEAADARDRSGVELGRRVDRVDQRVAAVADEVARAKTLWPVALRSLEARLDDVVHSRRQEAAPDAPPSTDAIAEDPSDDLLAGLRDSLQAMESVAAEMARASETLSEPFEEPAAQREPDHEPSDVPDVESEPSAAARGATIVPLRAGEP
jgi:chromosome segregation ATPase